MTERSAPSSEKSTDDNGVALESLKAAGESSGAKEPAGVARGEVPVKLTDSTRPEIFDVSSMQRLGSKPDAGPQVQDDANTSQKVEEKRKQDLRAEQLVQFIVVAVAVAIPFFAEVWPRLPSDTWRWLSVAGLVMLLVIALLLSRAQNNRFFAALRNSLFVVGITSAAALGALMFSPAAREEVFKLFVVVYFSLLPSFLYLQFISRRGRTIWEEYVDNLFRLRADDDASLPRPPPHSRFFKHWRSAVGPSAPLTGPAPRTLYLQKFESVFGMTPDDETMGAALNTEKLGPVTMATILLSVGWLIVTMPANLANWGSALASAGSTHMPLETIRFGFLGAYFFAVQMLVRRYFQNDLKAGAYLNLIMRVIVVALLAWTIDLTFANTVLNTQVVAFAIGVFPDVGWKALQATIKLLLRVVLPSLRQQYPLSDLDGLNVWYEARLLEEGVEDMQNLATCNLVDVMLNTRIPVDRLIDWVDQSLLYLHLDTPAKKSESPRARLRQFGIRTATDLEDAFARRDKQRPDAADEDHLKKLERVLNKDAPDPSMLRTLLGTLHCEPNFHHVRAWRREHEGRARSGPDVPASNTGTRS